MQVKYQEIFANGKKVSPRSQACFSNIYLKYVNPKIATNKIIYFVKAFKCIKAPVYGRDTTVDTLTLEEVTFWCEFLEKILNKKYFSYKIGTTPKTGRIYVIFNLLTKKLERYHALMYLTGFRYIDEFAPYVKDLFKNKEKSVGELFERFCANHHSGKDGFRSDGHSFIYSYMSKKKIILTLEQFKQNQLENKKTVNSYFQTLSEKDLTNGDTKGIVGK